MKSTSSAASSFSSNGSCPSPTSASHAHVVAMKSTRRSPRCRKDSEKTITTASPNWDYAYQWRKYGAKEIKGSHSKRDYYKCGGYAAGCKARKKVQMIKDMNHPLHLKWQNLDAQPLFLVNYEGEHSCGITPNYTNTDHHDQLIANPTDHPKCSSIMLQFDCRAANFVNRDKQQAIQQINWYSAAQLAGETSFSQDQWISFGDEYCRNPIELYPSQTLIAKTTEEETIVSSISTKNQDEHSWEHLLNISQAGDEETSRLFLHLAHTSGTQTLNYQESTDSP